MGQPNPVAVSGQSGGHPPRRRRRAGDPRRARQPHRPAPGHRPPAGRRARGAPPGPAHAEGAWAPGPALAELGRGGADLADLAGRHLVALRDVSGESAQFYVRDGATRVCVAAAERTSGLRDTVPVGARLPMTAGSAAHALLAFTPAEEVTRLLPVGELHRPHAARRPPPRLGAQRRRARAGRRLAVGAGARRRGRRPRRGLDLRPGRAAGPPAQPGDHRRRPRRRRRHLPRRPLTGDRWP